MNWYSAQLAFPKHPAYQHEYADTFFLGDIIKEVTEHLPPDALAEMIKHLVDQLAQKNRKDQQ